MTLDNLEKKGKIDEYFDLYQINDQQKEEILEVFASLEGVKKEDLPEIAEFMGEFKKLSNQYGKFVLRFKSSGMRAKIFELIGEEGASFVVKIPHIVDLKNKELSLEDMIREEKEQHQKIYQFYQNLLEKYIGTSEEELLNMIHVPMIHESTKANSKMIIMEKLTGNTVRYNVIAGIFYPLFQQKKFKIWLESNKSDIDIESFLLNLEETYPKKFLFDEGMLDTYPDITVSDMLDEIMIERPFNGDIFLQIFPEDIKKGKKLQQVYDFISIKMKEAGLEHPDPHMKNYMITDEGKLGIIDFGKELVFV